MKRRIRIRGIPLQKIGKRYKGKLIVKLEFDGLGLKVVVAGRYS